MRKILSLGCSNRMLAAFGILTAVLLGLYITCKTIFHNGPLLRQLLRKNPPLESDYIALTPVIDEFRNNSVFFYMPVGCTFDSQACSYLSGCSETYKYCDESSNSSLSTCNVNLSGNFGYQTLADKNQAIIRHMCMKKMYNNYDVFIKVDDDLLFNPDHTRVIISHLRLEPLSLLGYLHRREDNLIWPSGFFYAFTSELLRKLCNNEKALNLIKGKYEDVAFAKAVKKLHNVSYYNLDSLLFLNHISYQSSRVFIQFLQYGSCRAN